MGDEVYEDRYMLRYRHLGLVVVTTFLLPLLVACLMLNSFANSMDQDFKSEAILQKMWLGNECPINLSDASEIL